MFGPVSYGVPVFLRQPEDLEDADRVCTLVTNALLPDGLESELYGTLYGPGLEALYRRDMVLLSFWLVDLDSRTTGFLMTAVEPLGLLPRTWPGRKLKTREQQKDLLMEEYLRRWSGKTAPLPLTLELFATADLMAMRSTGDHLLPSPYRNAASFLLALFQSWLDTLREENGLADEVYLRRADAFMESAEKYVWTRLREMDAAREAYEASRAARPASLPERIRQWLSGTSAGRSEQEAAPAPPAPAEPAGSPAMAALQDMIGLAQVKEQVREFQAFITVQKERERRGLRTEPITLHMVFTGNPGTGKTTVARLIAQLLHEMGILRSGAFKEADRQHLVGNYLGSTALKTQAVINEAMGGVLFIDEAYSLCAKDDVYGSEAIATLLKAMEDHRDDLVVIIAGYEEPIRKLINSNPGLASRFARFIRFPDYTAEELFQVLEQMCRKSDYCLDPAAEAPLRALLEDKVRRKGEHFANAREVRNLFDAARTRQTLRIAGLKDADDQTYRTLTAEDFGLVPGKEQA